MNHIHVNPNIGCKYPATVDGVLVRDLRATIMRAAGFSTLSRPKMPDPNEGEAKCPTSFT